jgi:alanyl-tRNA synthetase
MKANELRQKYLDFFQSKGHTIIPSESLIPQNDPTVLFTTAGMHPLVPYLMGESHPGGTRVTNVQKCIRTSDIEEVGDSTHHTFFEMMGNWSFGDYFKKEAIEWSWEFLTSPQWLGLDKNRLACSVFAGDNDAAYDNDAFETWKKLGMLEARIAKLPKKNNWWGPAGETGPCGPDSEMFYWVGDATQVPDNFNDDNNLWVEIWNDVFMQFNKNKDGQYELLTKQNVDTGMGLERVLAVLNGLNDNYQSELFINIVKKIEELSGKKYNDNKKAIRIIADHIKAATFIIGDNKGLSPSNTDQGYIIRRLLRRAIRFGKQLGIEKENWTKAVAQVVINDFQETYPELNKNSNFILTEINKEEEKFTKTLENGLKVLNKEMKAHTKIPGEKIVIQDLSGDFTPHTITGQWLFDLYQTYGFPLEMSVEELNNQGKNIYEKELNIIKEEFFSEQKKHQDLSRTASAGKFKGGLADQGEETKKLHTTAHLLLAALRQVLGDHVVQRGSNITAERLRFDFSHNEKMTDEQKQAVEKLVNEAISKKLPITVEEMTLNEAKNKGAMGVFESKYGEMVKVYAVGDGVDRFSYEICGGPHINNTSELGKFKIQKEESSSSGVRRIKAILQ